MTDLPRLSAEDIAALPVPARASLLPAGFRLGVAASAYQIEGSTHAEGRTDSIWDTFCRVPGAVTGGDTGETACDHYRLMPQDVDLMAGLGADTCWGAIPRTSWRTWGRRGCGTARWPRGR